MSKRKRYDNGGNAKRYHSNSKERQFSFSSRPLVKGFD